MAIRVIVQIGDVDTLTDELRDEIVDAFVDAAQTPDVEILDSIEEGSPYWDRGARF